MAAHRKPGGASVYVIIAGELNNFSHKHVMPTPVHIKVPQMHLPNWKPWNIPAMMTAVMLVLVVTVAGCTPAKRTGRSPNTSAVTARLVATGSDERRCVVPVCATSEGVARGAAPRIYRP